MDDLSDSQELIHNKPPDDLSKRKVYPSMWMMMDEIDASMSKETMERINTYNRIHYQGIGWESKPPKPAIDASYTEIEREDNGNI